MQSIVPLFPGLGVAQVTVGPEFWVQETKNSGAFADWLGLSFRVTLAEFGPLFVTVMVYVAFGPPAVMVAGPLFVTATSAVCACRLNAKPNGSRNSGTLRMQPP